MIVSSVRWHGDGDAHLHDDGYQLRVSLGFTHTAGPNDTGLCTNTSVQLSLHQAEQLREALNALIAHGHELLATQQGHEPPAARQVGGVMIPRHIDVLADGTLVQRPEA